MGQTIGEYEILGRLGSGGMAEVFLARTLGEVGFEKRVAIKRMHPDLCREQAHVRTFADEARLVAQLNHPNIVHVYTFERDGASHYLVMEYIKGVTLSYALRLSKEQDIEIPSGAAVAIGVQVCDALAYAHDARTYDGSPMQIVHRDIKPANLMITRAGQVKITDFGVARATTNLHQTMPGMGKGTLAYMAPEQLEGEDIGPGADLFALAVVLFELFAGRRLFEDTGLSRFLERRKAGVQDEDLALLHTSMPEVADILARTLARDPADRFADAAAMGQALRELPSFHGRSDIADWLERLTIPDEPLDDLVTTSLPGRPSNEPTLLDADTGGGGAGSTVEDTGSYTTTSLSRPLPRPTMPPVEVVRDEPRRRSGLLMWLAGVLAVLGLATLLPPCQQLRHGTELVEEPITADAIGDAIDPATPDPVEELPTPEPPTAEPPTAEPPTPEVVQPDPPEVTPEPPTRAAMPEGEALVTITTNRWGAVYVDGVMATDESPLLDYPISLGPHRIRFVPADGVTPEGSFEIIAGHDGEKLTWRYVYEGGSWHAQQR